MRSMADPPSQNPRRSPGSIMIAITSTDSVGCHGQTCLPVFAYPRTHGQTSLPVPPIESPEAKHQPNAECDQPDGGMTTRAVSARPLLHSSVR